MQQDTEPSMAALTTLIPGVSENPSFISNQSDANLEHQLDQLRWVAYGIVAPIIIAVGLVGNIANLFVLSRPNLKSVTYVYLMWLAITDLLCQLFIIPSLVVLSGKHFGEDVESYHSAMYHAHVELALINGLMAASVFIVVALTMDRYVSISKPTKFKKIHTFRRARWTIGTACLSGVLLNVPMCFYKQVSPVPADASNVTYYSVQLNARVVQHSVWKVYLWTKEIMTRLGPALLLAILNAVIIRRFLRLVRKRRQRRLAQKVACRPTMAPSSMTSSAQDSSSGTQVSSASVSVTTQIATSQSSCSSFREERRLVMLLGGIVVMFFVAMTPAAFVSLFNADEYDKDFNFQLFRAFANDMEFLNYAMNFYVYCLCSSEIRRTFVQILCCNRLLSQEPVISTLQQQNVAGMEISEDPDPQKSPGPSGE